MSLFYNSTLWFPGVKIPSGRRGNQCRGHDCFPGTENKTNIVSDFFSLCLLLPQKKGRKLCWILKKLEFLPPNLVLVKICHFPNHYSVNDDLFADKGHSDYFHYDDDSDSQDSDELPDKGNNGILAERRVLRHPIMAKLYAMLQSIWTMKYIIFSSI